jgi:competence protein ComEC
MRLPFINILLPYVIIILIIENKLLSPNTILCLFYIISLVLIFVSIKFERARIIVFLFVISLYNLFLIYNLDKEEINVTLPEREVTVEVIFNKKKMISGDIYYVGLIKDININKKYLNELIIHSKLINFDETDLINKNVVIKGLLSYLNQNGYQELVISRCRILFKKEKKSIIDNIIIPLRKYIINTLDKSSNINPDLVHFQNGIFLGKTENISEGVYNVFKFSGTLHLFAVSGLHIGFIYVIFKKVFSYIFEQRITIEVLITIILILYLYLVNHPPSAVRALLMINSWQVSQIIFKKKNSISSLILSCFVVLLWDPGSIMEIGFQLSYTVVLSILIIRLNLRKKEKKQNSKIKDSLIISYAAFCGSFLLIFDYFQIIVPGSIFINILLIPFIFIVINCIFINLIFTTEFLNYVIYFNYKSIILITNSLSYSGLTFFQFDDHVPLHNISHIMYPISLFIFFSRFNRFLPRYFSYVLIPIIIWGGVTLIFI